MPTDFDPHAVLGIGRSASPDEIRGAYRRAALASHPDLHPGDDTAAERFKRVQEAYELLAAASPPPAPAPNPPSAGQATEPVRVRARHSAEEPISLARELGETVRAIRVMARRSGFRRRVSRLIRYLERL